MLITTDYKQHTHIPGFEQQKKKIKYFTTMNLSLSVSVMTVSKYISGTRLRHEQMLYMKVCTKYQSLCMNATTLIMFEFTEGTVTFTKCYSRMSLSVLRYNYHKLREPVPYHNICRYFGIKSAKVQVLITSLITANYKKSKIVMITQNKVGRKLPFST